MARKEKGRGTDEVVSSHNPHADWRLSFLSLLVLAGLLSLVGSDVKQALGTRNRVPKASPGISEVFWLVLGRIVVQQVVYLRMKPTTHTHLQTLFHQHGETQHQPKQDIPHHHCV